MKLVDLFGDLDERAWMLYAECRGVSPYLFYPDDELPENARRKIEREAKSICAHCVVQAECLSWAYRHNERNGVWGAKTERERRPRKRRRAS